MRLKLRKQLTGRIGRQEGLWATRVFFVYSVRKNMVYYVSNNDFKNRTAFRFDSHNRLFFGKKESNYHEQYHDPSGRR